MFVEPAFLWAFLAVAIPVAIHFWHQKRGKPLPWAAMRWLTEREQQQSRGIKLDNLWLLLVRCLVLILLAVLLAQPLLNWFENEPVIQRVHLVQPNARLTENFRFELAKARKNDESIVNLTSPLNPLALQTAIDNVPAHTTDLHLYVVNDPALADLPAITVPKQFYLYTVVDTLQAQPKPYLPGIGGKKIRVSRAGTLTGDAGAGSLLQPQPVTDTLRTLLNYTNREEQKTVRAALNALRDVYGLLMRIDEKPMPNLVYDEILTDQMPAKSNRQTLYVVSDIARTTGADNVVFTKETLTPQTSERVANGQLPEWLGEQLLWHYGLITDRQPLSKRALQGLFVTSTQPEARQKAGLQQLLTLLLVILLIAERGLALTKNA